MREHITHVAFDLHEDSITAAWLWPGAEQPEVRTLPNEPKALRRLVQQLLARGPARACYEAGPLGYAPQRQLAGWGLPCEVIAPALIPRRPGDRVKTDRRDAKKLVGLYRAGELTPVRIPTPEEEAARDLVRCREACGEDTLRAQHRLRKFLLRHALRCPTGAAGSKAWWAWVQTLRLPDPPAQRTLDEYRLTATTLLGRRQALAAEVQALAAQAPWASPVARLRALRGIDTLTAVTLAVEVVDFRRFATPRPFMSFLGRVPREHSSGRTPRRGSLTQAGNAHLRRVVVEAAWHSQHRPAVSRALRARQAGQPPAVLALSEKAQRRLYRRFTRLVARGKRPVIAATAVARELCGFIWALMVEVPA